MNKSRLAVAVIAAGLVTGSQLAVAAKGFDYTYAEAGYRRIDGDSLTGNGFNAGFSFGATDMFVIDGRYSRVILDDVDGTTSSDLNTDEFKIGFGAHYAVSDNFDVVGMLRYVDLQLSGDARLDGDDFSTSFNEDVEGYEVELGGRYQASKEFEISPHLIYLDAEGEDDTGFGAGVVYRLNRTFSLRGNLTWFEDDSELDLFAGLRMNM